MIDAKRQLDDQEAERQRKAEEKAEKLENKPFDDLVDFVVANEESIENVLNALPFRACSTVRHLLEHIGRLRAMKEKTPLPAIREHLLSELVAGPGGGYVNWRHGLPERYEECFVGTVYTRAAYVRWIQAIMSAQIGSTAFTAVRDVLVSQLPFQFVRDVMTELTTDAVVASGAVMGLGAYMSLSREAPTIIKAVHHFAYERVSAEEQRKLSHDRRNMSFRLARGLETSVAVRVTHTVTFEYMPSSLMKEIRMFFFESRSGCVTRIPWEPVPEQSHVTVIGRSAEQNHGLALEIPVGGVVPSSVARGVIRDLVPSLDGNVLDATLFQWLTTHPRLMDATRAFDDVKSFVRMSLCTNGQVVNDFTSGDYTNIYTTSAVASLVKFLSLKNHASASTAPGTQEWAFQ